LADGYEYFFAAPSFTYNINDTLNLEVCGRVSTKRNKHYENDLTSGAELASVIVNELSAGGSAKLNWRTGMNNLLVGTDYDNGAVDSAAIKDDRQSQVRWALFANDSFTKWDFTITPGLRYDHTSTNGTFVSPSLGITYSLFEKTIFRAYVARGFNTPSLGSTFGDGISSLANPSLKPEKVLSYSLGVETAVVKYLWLKATAFLNEISDVLENEQLSATTFTTVNGGKQRRQGVEAELRTVPLYNTSLKAGFSFIDTKDRTTGQVIPNFPRWTYDLGVDYNDNEAWRGALRGHYIWWNSEADANGKYTAMIWDLNLARKVIERDRTVVEVFFTAHNIFDGAQYSEGLFPNPQRWFEGGIKCKF
jgi:vitamin B12 transporter